MRYSASQYWRSTLYSVLASLLIVGAFACGDGDIETDDGKQELAAPEVQPVELSGNPSCSDLGLGDFEYKLEPVASGTYSMDGIHNVTITVQSTTDGQVFDWSTDIPVDGVIVKGGPGANLYDFTPEEYDSGTGYHAPTNQSNGRYYGLSHISFCFDYNLEASKTANTSLTRTYEWTIEKLVSPASWSLFDGDSGTSDYTVEVDKTGHTDSNFKVSGTISITNPAPFTATITGVDDELSNGMTPAVDCGVTFPHDLLPGATLDCTYQMTLADATNLENKAVITTSGKVDGDDAYADVDFGSATISKVNDTIDINDTNGMSWSASSSTVFSYSRTFACGGDEGTHPNTASISQTGQNASASVTVACHELTVDKTANTSALRTYEWDIQKAVTGTDPQDTTGGTVPTLYIELDEFGQGSGTVEYTVDITKIGFTDSDFTVSGQINISNPNPTRAADLTEVTDLIDGTYAGVVDCPSTTVPAGGTLTCTYTASVPDDQSRTNVATATQQNYDYASDGTATATGTTSYTGSMAYSFSSPFILELNALVTVVDSLLGISDLNLGQFSDSGSVSYTQTFDCAFHQGFQTNIASILETGQNDDEMINVVCVEPPDEGCTPGYWKNHLSSWGATGYAPSDLVTGVFASAASYVGASDTLLMALDYGGGSSYSEKVHILLRAGVAALLNAASPDVDYAFSPADVINKVETAILSGSGDDVLSAAKELDDANNAGCPLN